ncbi:MAG: hydrogenase maturation nickel metallochaperone HypA [Micrococcales bacterium]|nr:hydrogenase maturation nickel metallochaperone HypA [Micrococcales bacterium]MCL2667002.1 hydrogenase maturation nickel metallochaperone HypA [Micrococcales bacterium]
MHEVSLCRQVAAAVTRATAGRHVQTVYVTVGELRQVVPEAMAHAWTFVVRGTALDGARLELHHVQAVVTCDDCQHNTRLGRQLGFDCPACGSSRTHVSAGEEFVLTAVDVDGPDDDCTPEQEGTLDGALSPS